MIPIKYKMIDLFAGTGAFSYVLSKTNKIECVFSNDMCEASKKIYDLNHENSLLCKDLNELDTKDIPKHDILCGGFPCQPFSIAGKQEGFNDSRSNVFWKILEILDYHNTKIILLENVKNLETHDNGKTFSIIKSELNKRGYYLKHSILNTSELTEIPQNRERIYIIGFKDKNLYEKFNFDFPKVENKPIISYLQVDVDDKYYYSEKFKVYNSVKDAVTKNITDNVIYQYRRYYVRENKSGVCPTLTANMGGGGHNVPLLLDTKGIRKLTPRECFNLQGFPSDYKLPNICDSALYHLAGNAVSIPIIELIAQKLKEILPQKNLLFKKKVKNID